MIINIPVWLAYSPEAERLLLDKHMIYDTPVYRQDHSPHEEGRRAIQTVLEARVTPALFADGQMVRLIVASGGNLRDLFSLVVEAGDGAKIRNPDAKLICQEDATKAINKLRRDYRNKLGESPFDLKPIADKEKMDRLLAVYNNAPGNKKPNPVHYSLLRARALQEFNGPGWFGVHPLVVDILKDEEQLLNPAALGGTF